MLSLAAPFSGEPVEIAKVKQRYAGLSWFADGSRALLDEYDENRHWRTTTLVDVDDLLLHARAHREHAEVDDDVRILKRSAAGEAETDGERDRRVLHHVPRTPMVGKIGKLVTGVDSR